MDIFNKSEVRSGFFFVISLHTTTGFFINEGIFDVEADIIDTIMRLAPDDGSYHHACYLPSDEQMGVNAVSHIRSVLLSFECFFTIENGAPLLGGRQTIYFIEPDRLQECTFVLQVFGVLSGFISIMDGCISSYRALRALLMRLVGLIH